jgi:Flp pilus assembly protein TadG
MSARTGRSGDRERGAVAVIVAICAVVLFGMAAFAIDVGDAWQTRRRLITATDAAALAAAQKYAEGGDGCATEPATFVAANDVGASVTSCSFNDLEPGAGYVTVDAEKTVDFRFAGVLGITSDDITSTTTAAYGQALAVSGLRPFGLCDKSTAFSGWLADDKPTPSDAIQIPYTKDSPDDCGANAPGNWSILDFDGGANSNRDTMDWVHDGYPGEIDSEQTVEGDTGAFSNSLNSQLTYLRDNAIEITLPIYTSVTGDGANAVFQLIDFVSLVIVDFQTTGPEETRYLTVRFVTDVVQGRCCKHDTDTGVRVVMICAVTEAFDPENCRDR